MPASLLRSGGLVGFTEQWPFRVIQQSAFFLALLVALSLTEKDRLRRLSRICKTVSSPSSFLARPFPIPIQSPPRRSPSSKKKCTSWSRFNYLFSVSLSLSVRASHRSSNSSCRQYDPQSRTPVNFLRPRSLYNTHFNFTNCRRFKPPHWFL